MTDMNLTASLDDRMVGTPLTPAPSLARLLDIQNLYLKLETHGPTGSQKDRVARRVVNEVLQRGYRELAVATCGNYGAALAVEAAAARVVCRVVIPLGYCPPEHKLQFMARYDARIVRLPGYYEDSVEYVRLLAQRYWLYDANPGGPAGAIQRRGYETIAYEIAAELGFIPDIVAVPLGNGTTLAGIYNGFLCLAAIHGYVPRLVAGSSRFQNPVVESIRAGTPYSPLRQFPYATNVSNTRVNEPLVNIDSLDGDAAVAAIRASRGAAFGFADKELIEMARLASEMEGLALLPAATAGLLALQRLARLGYLAPRAVCVAIITASAYGEYSS